MTASWIASLTILAVIIMAFWNWRFNMTAMGDRRFVITTGKGDVYVTFAASGPQASTKFYKKFPGVVIASVVEADEF